jgi:hypothetical protein
MAGVVGSNPTRPTSHLNCCFSFVCQQIFLRYPSPFAIVLEQEIKFAQFDQPSQTFLKFAAQFLSNKKSDINNNSAFRSCLLRIPGSYNSKYIEQNKGIAEVKIIQRWDGFRPKINPLLHHFYIYLADRKLKEFNNMSNTQSRHPGPFPGNTTPWIEKLLETPIDDYRKNAVSLILAPYLVNIKKYLMMML